MFMHFYTACKQLQRRFQDYHFLIFWSIFFIMVILAFLNLGNRYMWLDEGITAQIGKNTLLYGYPRIWDDINLSTTNNGLDFGEHFMFTKENWLPFYIVAIGEWMGGGNFFLRLPFVICGIASAVVFYLFVKLLTNKNTALMAFCLYAFSIPLLLYFRQVRYYAITLLLVNLIYYFYLKTRESINSNRRYWILLTINLILLFHTQYMAFACTALSLLICFILIDRRFNKPIVWICVCVVGLFTLPWFLFVNLATYSYNSIKPHFFEQLIGYICQIHVYFFPFLPLGLFAIGIKIVQLLNNRVYKSDYSLIHTSTVSFPKIANKSHIVIPVSAVISNIIIISLFTDQYNTRFLIPCLFACYLLCAMLVMFIIKQIRIFGWLLLMLLLLTNILHISPYLAIKITGVDMDTVPKIIAPPLPHFENSGHSIIYDLNTYIEEQCVTRSYLCDYLFEISNDYDDATKGLILFLNTYAESGDTIYILNRYHWHTVSYYTGLKIANRLVESADPGYYQSIAYKNYLKYSNLTAQDYDMIDWYVFYPYGETNDDLFRKLLADPNLDCIQIAYPEAPELPDIWSHSFWTDVSYPYIYVFRNKLTKGHILLDINEFAPEKGGK